MAISNFLSNIRNMWIGTNEMYNDYIVPSILTGQSPMFDPNNADKVSTVYTCIKILADTLSRVPLNVYSVDSQGSKPIDKSDYRYPILHYAPNNWSTQQTFFASLEYWRNIKGNSFARIYRDGAGKVKSLVLIPPSKVTKYAVTNGELYYTVLEDNNKENIINSSEILHFKSLTKDGIWGINPLEALRLNVSSTWQGLQTIDQFYRNNAASPKAIKSTVSGANQKAMLESLQEFKLKYAGSSNAGQIIPLPPNTEIIDLALNYADAAFIDTIKFNATQIGALYGIPPHMLGILEASKFNNVEMLMLDFKANTLSAIARMYRQEMESKLLTTQERIAGKSIEFNLDALLEADSTTRINNLRTLMNQGVISINDVAKIEGWATFPAGDNHFLPGNYLTVEQIANKPAAQPTTVTLKNA